MSKPPLPEAAVAMLEKANPAVICTLRRDGQPVSAATWYLWDDGRVLINMDEGGWYTHVTIIGRVVDLQEDTDLSGIDRLSRQYLGKDYGQRDRRRYSAWIEIDRWHGWGALKDNEQPG